MLECCSLHFREKKYHEIVKFWTAKATKIIRFLYLLRNADVSKKFC